MAAFPLVQPHKSCVPESLAGNSARPGLWAAVRFEAGDLGRPFGQSNQRSEPPKIQDRSNQLPPQALWKTAAPPSTVVTGGKRQSAHLIVENASDITGMLGPAFQLDPLGICSFLRERIHVQPGVCPIMHLAVILDLRRARHMHEDACLSCARHMVQRLRKTPRASAPPVQNVVPDEGLQ